MSNLYQIYLISDATGETLDRIFIAIKAQFKNINYKIHTYSFTRTENQIIKILESAEKEKNSIGNSKRISYRNIRNKRKIEQKNKDHLLKILGILLKIWQKIIK